MPADLAFIACVVGAVALIGLWEAFLLTHLAAAERVRLLPRWVWALACLFQIPLGGIAYLIFGRVWKRAGTTSAG